MTSPRPTARRAGTRWRARPVSARIRDVRSVWGPPLELPIGEQVTVLVGPNRSGTSNVAWALAAALDPDLGFVPDRDVPWGREGSPAVTVSFDDGSRLEVGWDPAHGEPRVTGPPARSHVVLSRIADAPRDAVLRAGLELEDPDVREALAGAVRDTFRTVLPEVDRVDVDARGIVHVRDDLGAALPVPEIRAIVALGLAAHLAERGTPPVATVVEAPEVFLHPAAQEQIATVLLEVAEVTGSPVVVTTISPFAIPRVAAATVVAVARDVRGRTELVGSAPGDAAQARLLGGLLRDAGLAAVLDRVGRVPPDARGVVIVEGGTDEAYLRIAADRLGRTEVLDGLVLRPSGGAMGAALAAIVLRAELDVPLLVLLDHDDAGRRARDTLVSRFGFDRSRQIVTYADVFDGHPTGVVAETLFDLDLVRRFVAERGPGVAEGERAVQGIDHVELTSSGKSAFVGWVTEHARPEHLARWDALLDLLAERLARVR